jgi:hypothetical protein
MDNLNQSPNTTIKRLTMATFFQEPFLPSAGGMLAQVSGSNSLGGDVSAPTDALTNNMIIVDVLL